MERYLENLEERVYPAFPLLRPSIDALSEDRFAQDSEMWRLFLEFRESSLPRDRAPDSRDDIALTAHSLLWFEQMQHYYGVVEGGVGMAFSNLLWGSYSNSFKSVLAEWRTEWLELLDKFIPPNYRQYFDDKDGVVSATEDPFKLLFISKPESYDNKIWRYRRWWARRDWFLGNLGLLLNVYRNSFDFYDIAIKLDNYLRLDGETFMDTDLAQRYNLPARKLTWGGRVIPVYCDWNKKSLFSLLQKVLIKQYNGHKNIFDSIFDILRGRFVVEEQDLSGVCDFIEKNTDLHLCEEDHNRYTADGWKVIRYKGFFDKNDPKSKFELQVQDVNTYMKVAASRGDDNHLSYKARQFLTLLTIMLPPTLLADFFGLSFANFLQDYEKRVGDLLALEQLGQEL